MMESRSTSKLSNGSGFRASSGATEGLAEGEVPVMDAKQV